MESDQQHRRLNLMLLSFSYPTLKEINFFRDYHDYVENSLKDSIEGIKKEKDGVKGEKVRKLTMEHIKNKAEIKKYNELINIMRFSLFVSLYAYTEKIVTNACRIEGREKEYNKFSKKHKGKMSTISIAKRFLIREGYIDINRISGWQYIDDMREIRNQFVHASGKTTKSIDKMTNKYNFKISDKQIILGANFVLNFLELIESFSPKFMKMVLPVDNNISKLLKKDENN